MKNDAPGSLLVLQVVFPQLLFSYSFVIFLVYFSRSPQKYSIRSSKSVGKCFFSVLTNTYLYLPNLVFVPYCIVVEGTIWNCSALHRRKIKQENMNCHFSSFHFSLLSWKSTRNVSVVENGENATWHSMLYKVRVLQKKGAHA